MSTKQKAWLFSGVVHLGILSGLIFGYVAPASGQGRLPIGEDRPIEKSMPVKQSGTIQPVELENLTPAAKSPDVAELKPGQIKAFASGDGVSWDLVPKSDDATEDGLVMREANGGAIIFAFDVDSKRFGDFKVPDNQQVIIIAANPGSKGKYLLSKLEVVGGKAKIVERKYIVIAGDSEKKDQKKDDPPTPKPVVSGRKLVTIVIEETEDKVAGRYAFFESKEVRDYYKSKGHSDPVIVDQDVKDARTMKTPEKLQPYIDRAKGKSLPQVYLVDEKTGEVLLEGELSSMMSAKDFLELVKKAGG